MTPREKRFFLAAIFIGMTLLYNIYMLESENAQLRETVKQTIEDYQIERERTK